MKVDSSFTSGPKTFDEVQDISGATFPQVQAPTNADLASRIQKESDRTSSAITDATAAATDAQAAAGSAKDAADSAKTVGIIGIVVGAIGLIVGVGRALRCEEEDVTHCWRTGEPRTSRSR